MSRALDQIKLNHELTGFDVVGQSARGTLAIAMVEKRKDVRCAISAAGALSIIEAERILGFQPDTKYLARVIDPIDHVTEIEKRENLRIFILNDPADSVVDQKTTKNFLAMLDKYEVRYQHIEVEASDSIHHGLQVQGIRAAMACARGKTDAAISHLVGRSADSQK